MADSLLLDGVDNEIKFSLGGAGVVGAMTVAIVAKRGTNAEYTGLIGTFAGDEFGGRWWLATYTDAQLVFWTQPSGDSPAGSFEVADGWCILVASRDSGGTVRFSIYEYGTDTWTHTDAGGAQTNPAATADLLIVGNTSDAFFHGNVLIAGIWDMNLSDGAIEALDANTLDAWISAAPDELIRFDSMSALAAIVGTCSETSRVGTTLDTGDVPAGWTDDLGGETAPFASVTVR